MHRGSDAVSLHSVTIVLVILNVLPVNPSQLDIQQSNNISNIIKSTDLMATFAGSNNIAMISPVLIHAVGCGNPQYEKLISVIQQGFPRTCNLTAPKVHEYWEVRHRLSIDNGLVLLDQRIVIPKMQERKVLHSLHSAHQAHANGSVYWPAMDALIHSIRANCMVCSNITPSQP